MDSLHGAKVERNTSAFVEKCEIRQVLVAGLPCGGRGSEGWVCL